MNRDTQYSICPKYSISLFFIAAILSGTNIHFKQAIISEDNGPKNHQFVEDSLGECLLIIPAKKFEQQQTCFIVMRLDEVSLMADLGTTISWTKQYFDKNSEPVVNMFQVLDRSQTDVAGIGVPALSVGLDAIKNYRLQRNEENI